FFVIVIFILGIIFKFMFDVKFLLRAHLMFSRKEVEGDFEEGDLMPDSECYIAVTEKIALKLLMHYNCTVLLL
ncbi:hypothetical protein ACJX0J_024470, partial [Zea mays]